MSSMDWEEIRQVAARTIGQAENPLWVQMRQNKLTASKFGEVLSKECDFAALSHLSQMLEKPIPDCLPMRWGRDHEKHAILRYSRITKNIVVQTGLWMFPSGNLAASPDGLVKIQGDDCFTGIVEIKCPFGLRNVRRKQMMDERKWPKCFKNRNFDFDTGHCYYHQIQGQLYATKMLWCDFFVWTPWWNILKRVYPDKGWQERSVPRLERLALQIDSKLHNDGMPTSHPPLSTHAHAPPTSRAPTRDSI